MGGQFPGRHCGAGSGDFPPKCHTPTPPGSSARHPRTTDALNPRQPAQSVRPKVHYQAERLFAIRLRYLINTHLDDRGLTAAPDIARAVSLPAAEAVRLLTRRQWRAGDGAALRAVAARLGLEVPLEGLEPSAEEGGTP